MEQKCSLVIQLTTAGMGPTTERLFLQGPVFIILMVIIFLIKNLNTVVLSTQSNNTISGIVQFLPGQLIKLIFPIE